MKTTHLLFALGALPIVAAPIPIVNASFEIATLTTIDPSNGAYNNLVPGSTISATGGTLSNWSVNTTAGFNSSGGAFAPSPGGNNWTSSWWGGNNIGYLQLTGLGTASLSQSLSATLASNTTYTLSAQVGRRNFTPDFRYAIELWAGPTLNGATLLGSASNLALSSNSSGTDSLTYGSGSANALTGQSLYVVLRSTNTGAAFTETFFDNVGLDASASTPEPTTLLLGGLGLAAIGLRQRRGYSK